jgi:hypothetical protein
MANGKIMIIRHAEKPGSYPTEPGVDFKGVNFAGKPDSESLVTLGWERAGGLVSLFAPSDGHFKNPALATPTFIYAADPNEKASKADGPSQRPFETISALATKLGLTPNTSYKKDDYPDMVKDVLERAGNGVIVLVSWQHQDILAKAKGDDSIMTEIVNQTGADPSALGIPPGPWPGDRYDLVFVVDLADSGKLSAFTQVPQLLLAGDSSQPISNS